MKQTLLRNLLMLDAALLMILGAALIFAPIRVEEVFGFKDLPVGVSYILGLWGSVLATMGIGYLVAASDPMRHVVWVQMAIARNVLEGIFGAVCLARGIVNAQQAGFGIGVAIAVTLAYITLYPRANQLPEEVTRLESDGPKSSN